MNAMLPSAVQEKTILLPVARFHFKLVAASSTCFPENKGATLRGGFGYALKAAACTVPDTACPACSLYRSCAYPYLFETPPPEATSRMPKGTAIPRPFVLEPPPEGKSRYEAGESFTIGLVLIGRGRDFLPYFVAAFEKLGKRGIGPGRGRFRIERMIQEDDQGKGKPVPVDDGSVEPRHVAALPDCRSITLRFLTPTRIVEQGRPVDTIGFPLLFRTLLRRIENLRAFHGPDQEGTVPLKIPPHAEKIRLVETRDLASLHWIDQARYSRRQGRWMPQGGFVEEIVFEGEMGPFLPLLKLGEAVHVGKGVTFGMGRFEIDTKDNEVFPDRQADQDNLHDSPSVVLVKNRSKQDAFLMVMGDFSGIQTYIFDVAEGGGGQAKRLRSRSFRVQVISEIAGLKVLNALGWTWDQVVYANAAKFLFSGPMQPDAEGKLRTVLVEIERHLLEMIGGVLRFSLSWKNIRNTEDERETMIGCYEQLQSLSNRAKLQPWTTISQKDLAWNPSKLVLEPLNSPCVICRHVEATEEDEHDDIIRNICKSCKTDEKIGRQLPKSTTLFIEKPNPKTTEEIFGYGIRLSNQTTPYSNEHFVAAVSLSDMTEIADHLKTQNLKDRRLTRYIPLDHSGAPLQFTDIANKSRGDKLLGILKADVDSLGLAIYETLEKKNDLSELGRFSKEIDSFFSMQIIRLMKANPFDTIYTVFSGGDDLLLVGPWNVIIDFSEQVQKLFSCQPGLSKGLTLSAGIAIAKPRVPIKFAVEQADELLDIAKLRTSNGASQPKDQCAVLGQCWKWSEHSEIIKMAKQLADWIDNGVCIRGWVQSILNLSEARKQGEFITTSRLAYLISRNFPSVKDKNRNKAALRRWADGLLDHFDASDTTVVRYLSAICRYALIATRSSQNEDR